jgi:hypothetical protein
MDRQYSQPLIVKPDPRVHLTEAAFVREFELAQKVELAVFQASQALDQATKLLNSLEARLAQPRAAHAELTALLARATDISGTRPHPERLPQLTGKPPRRTESLQALSTDLNKLEEAVDGADSDPGPDARVSYAMLSSALTPTLAEWRRFINRDLARVNADLKAAGEPPIAPEEGGR